MTKKAKKKGQTWRNKEKQGETRKQVQIRTNNDK